MKTVNYGAAIALAAYLVLALAACSKTDNGSNNSTAAAATQCVIGSDGIARNQLGQSCVPGANVCQGYTYNPQTGMYIGPNGQQIPASNCAGANTIPNNGYYGGTYVNGTGTGYGCDQWSQYYGITYVPVNIGNGQMVCVNYQYLQSQIMMSYPQYQYTPYYNNPSQWYSYAPSAYDYGYGYGSGYTGGYGYGCGTGISLGLSTGGFSGGVSLCF
jgi:hypothetical protein